MRSLINVLNLGQFVAGNDFFGKIRHMSLEFLGIVTFHIQVIADEMRIDRKASVFQAFGSNFIDKEIDYPS
jgi:hypothetical protein